MIKTRLVTPKRMGRQDLEIAKIDISFEEFLSKSRVEMGLLLEEDMGLRKFFKDKRYFSIFMLI